MKVIIKLIKWWQTAAALELHQIPSSWANGGHGNYPGTRFWFSFWLWRGVFMQIIRLRWWSKENVNLVLFKQNRGANALTLPMFCHTIKSAWCTRARSYFASQSQFKSL